MGNTMIVGAMLVSSLAAATATASPTKTCAVDIVRAPDEVRAAIEEQLGDAPTCAPELQVRVVATDDGFYVIGLGGNTVLEDTVGDAAAVAALIAGWEGGLAAKCERADRARAPEADTNVDPIKIVDDKPVDEPASTQAARSRATRLDLGGLVGAGDGGGTGARFAIDAWSRGRWSVGAGFDLSQVTISAAGFLFSSPHEYQFLDLTATVHAAYTWSSGPWHARSFVGLGYIHTTGSVTTSTMSTPVSLTSQSIELGATFGRDFGRGWGLDVGPLFTVFKEVTPGNASDPSTGFERTNRFLVFVGATHVL